MLTLMLQEVLAPTVPPLRLILVVPAVAVTMPPQPSTTPGVDETVRPVGNVSVNARPVSGAAFGLVIWNVTVVLPPTGIEGTAKVFKILGGPTTMRVALELLPVPPSVEVTGPAVFR